MDRSDCVVDNVDVEIIRVSDCSNGRADDGGFRWKGRHGGNVSSLSPG